MCGLLSTFSSLSFSCCLCTFRCVNTCWKTHGSCSLWLMPPQARTWAVLLCVILLVASRLAEARWMREYGKTASISSAAWTASWCVYSRHLMYSGASGSENSSSKRFHFSCSERIVATSSGLHTRLRMRSISFRMSTSLLAHLGCGPGASRALCACRAFCRWVFTVAHLVAEGL